MKSVNIDQARYLYTFLGPGWVYHEEISSESWICLKINVKKMIENKGKSLDSRIHSSLIDTCFGWKGDKTSKDKRHEGKVR